MVLVMVLIVVAMISLAGFSFAELMFTENKAVHLYGYELQAEQSAASGVELVKSVAQQSVAARQQSGGWLDNPLLFQSVPLASLDREDAPGRFSIMSPRIDESGEPPRVRYGLENESARLNLAVLPRWDERSPGAARRALLKLPRMTPTAADALLDWIDADDQPREHGAETDFYAELDPPYAPRNGVPQSLEEMLLVKGVWRELLFGDPTSARPSDAEGSRAGVDAVAPSDIAAGPPWASLLTLYSGERNQTVDGNPRINLNDSRLPRLHQRLGEAFDERWAGFIVAYRQYGPYSGGGSASSNESDGSIEPDLSAPAKFTLASLLDLVDARVQVPASGGRKARVLKSPLASGDGLRETLPRLLDQATVTDAPVFRGKVNVNLAPVPVLRAIPGVDSALAERIVVARAAQGEQDIAPRQHPTWLLTERLVDLRRMKALLPYVTTGGDVFRAEVIGFSSHTGPVARAEVVVDGAVTPARQVYWKDLRTLSRGYQTDMLDEDARGERSASVDRSVNVATRP